MRYSLFVDGFNMYHALNDPAYLKDGNTVYPYRKYKWINYRKILETKIKKDDSIEAVYYFSAFAYWRKHNGTIDRHKKYIKALRSVGVKFVRGRFLEKYKTCHQCDFTYKAREEKRTDINIALEVLCRALDDEYDRAVIISADSDLMPVIQKVHDYAPDKEVGIMLPFGRSGYDLRQKADFIFKMDRKILEASQFPDSLTVGSTVLERPESWK